jgi:hypothetical protein
VEEQTDGQIGREDFYSIPCASKLTNFVEAVTGKDAYRLSAHFACGAGTYIFNEGGKLIPVTRFIDVPMLFETLDSLTQELNTSSMPLKDKLAEAKLLLAINKSIDTSKVPKGLDIKMMLINALVGGTYESLGKFHEKSLFIGMMHFMDPYNYDIERVKRCAIHYALPDGRVVPFCAFNVIPDLYRDKDQRNRSISTLDWEKMTGKSLDCDKHIRKIPEGAEADKIRDFYRQYIKA